jgi:hypothetical protein
MASLDTEARGLLPFYGLRNYPILSSSQLDTFTVLRQNALTFSFTLPPPYGDSCVVSAPARHEDRRSLLFMNYIHARLFKRSLLVLSVKVAFTLLLPWIRRHEDFYRFTRILCSCTLLPSYAKMPSLLPYPHPMAFAETRRTLREAKRRGR